MNHPNDSGIAETDSPSVLSERPGSAAPSQRRAFLLLFASLISVGMGQSLMFAILPPVARNLGLSEVQVGAIFAVSAVLWVLASPFWGRRSDMWGRRPIILTGLLGFAVSMALFGACVQASLAGWLALLPAYVLMIASRSIFGLFGAATIPAAHAYVADRTEPEERATHIAMQGAAFGLGVTLGPGVVSLLLVFGLVAPFYGVAALAFLGALLVARGLPEQAPPQSHRRPRRRMSPFDPRVMPFMVVGILLGIVQATAMQTVGFYAIDILGMSIEESARSVGYALMGTAGAGLFVQLVVIRLFKPLPRTMMSVGALCGMIAFGVLVFGNSYPMLFTAMVLLGLAFGLIRPGTSAGASLAVSGREQGAVAGLMNTTGAIGVIFAPFVGMSLYQLMPRAPYVLDLVLMAAALAFVVLRPPVRRRRH